MAEENQNALSTLDEETGDYSPAEQVARQHMLVPIAQPLLSIRGTSADSISKAIPALIGGGAPQLSPNAPAKGEQDASGGEGPIAPAGGAPASPGVIHMPGPPVPVKSATAKLFEKAQGIESKPKRILAEIGSGILRGIDTAGEALFPRVAAGIPGSNVNAALHTRENEGQYEREQAHEVAQEHADAAEKEADAKLNPRATDQGKAIDELRAGGMSAFDAYMKVMHPEKPEKQSLEEQVMAARAVLRDPKATPEQKQQAQGMVDDYESNQNIKDRGPTDPIKDLQRQLIAEEAKPGGGDPKIVAQLQKEMKDAQPIASQRLTINEGRQGNQGDKRTDASYEKSSGKIDKMEAPIEAHLASLSSAIDVLDQHTMASDSLGAAAIMKAYVGGPGSGVRITNPEIERIMGGLPKWQAFKVKLTQIANDQNSAVQFDKDERAAFKKLLTLAQSKAQQKLNIIDDAQDALIDAGSAREHRKIVNDMNRKLQTIDGGGSAQSGAKIPPPAGATFKTQ